MANPPEPWYENLDSSAPFKANEVVKLCEHGTNGVLSIRPTVELWGDDVHSEYGIAVDHPKLTGTIDTKTLNEADQIITSIKGIVTLQN